MDLSVARKPLCHICYETAYRDHLNYGAISCYSCRAFFRRIHKLTVDKPKFVCKFGGDCEITLKTRRKCKRCRYDLCVRAGMRPKSVLKEGERKSRFKNSFYKQPPEGEEEEEEQEEPVEEIIVEPPINSFEPMVTMSTPPLFTTSDVIKNHILLLNSQPGIFQHCPCLTQFEMTESPLNRVQLYQVKRLTNVKTSWENAYRDFRRDPEFISNLVRTQEGKEELSNTLFRQHLTRLSELFSMFAKGLTCFQVRDKASCSRNNIPH